MAKTGRELRIPILILFFALLVPATVARSQVVIYRIELPEIDWVALAALLPAQGPQAVDTASGVVDARGFLAAGWPVVVDFELEQKGRLVLRIGTEDDFERIVLKGNKNRRKLESLKVPERLGKSIRAGRFSFQGLDKKDQPIDFELYGIGVGKRAVGSLAIERVEFGPETIRIAASEEAEYSFVSKVDFEDLSVQILRQRYVAEEMRFENTLVQSSSVDCERRTPCGDRWNGLSEDGRPSPGSHLLQIKAWFRTPERKQHWTLVRSADRVSVDPE